jgi:hypothetical protein
MRIISSTPLPVTYLTGLSAKINLQRGLNNLLRLVAIIMGAVHTWAASTVHSMNPDGVNYLDMGEAYWRGDWAMALNSVWSPLYSWILGFVMRTFQPPMDWEFPAVHITNFIIFLATILCFEFFMRQLTKQLSINRIKNQDEAGTPIAEWLIIGIGYSLFIWSSLVLIKIWSVNPDMLVAAIAYLAGGIILGINNGKNSWKMFTMLGLVLGAGFLAKAAMLPIGFIFLVAAIISRSDNRFAISKYLLSFGIFALISLSFISAISVVNGRITFGDAGLLTYVRHVNGIPYPHWQGEIHGFGVPINPSRKILNSPPIYEFGSPIGGTYPISYDPAYWYKGVIPSYSLKDLTAALATSGMYYFDLFFRQQAALVFGVIILFLLSSWRRTKLQEAFRNYSLLIPAIAAFLIYALIYVEGRYIAPFVVIFWSILLAGVRLPESISSGRLVTAVGGVIILFIFGNLIYFNFNEIGAFNARTSPQVIGEAAPPPSWPGEVAQELHRLGIEPGRKVGVIGYAFDSYWARLAKVQIVAEMFSWEAYPFWLGDEAKNSEVIQAFRLAGAQAIVAEKVPDYITPTGWQRVGQSNYYIYLLNQ